MLLQITNLTKSVFDKQLYDKLNLIIEKGEKSALIGQNGVGKTTLFKILIGEEKDFEGKIELASGTRIEITQQEHLRKDFTEKKTAIEYILDSVPSYNKLKKILNEYSNGDEVTEEYLSALADFTDMNYFNIEDEIASMLEGFQITLDKALSPMLSLSGGEKRFVELTKVIFSNADLILIDEPTNHLDYIGKEVFLDWLKSTKKTVLIITHDRDVLKEVSKIYELKNHIITHFNGNYTAYLKQNLHTTLSQLNKYETDLAKIEKLKKQADDAYLKKLTAKSDKGRLRAKILEERMKREYKKVVENMHKPSFWIDTENEGMIDKKIKESYSKYKSKNINLSGSNFAENKNIKKLFSVRDFVIGYDKPLFKEISFDFFSGMRLQLIGRNGAGKSSFIKYLLSLIVHEYPNENSLYQELIDTKSDLKKYYGEIEIKNNIKVGIYEQEVSEKYINMTLFNAIRQILIESNIPVNPTVINALMKQYLFNEKIYESAFMYELSGGEKARFQIMRALLNKPSLLILDEPTNHLDLPSIEVLEKFLSAYTGGVLFVSHDSFFTKSVNPNNVIIVEK